MDEETVYYDTVAEDFVRFKEEDDTLTEVLWNDESSTLHEWQHDELETAIEEGDFKSIPQEVVDNPRQVVDAVFDGYLYMSGVEYTDYEIEFVRNYLEELI